jgi:hypothetical protein
MSHKALMNIDEMEAVMQAARERQAASLSEVVDRIMEDVAVGQHGAANANPPSGNWTIVVADNSSEMTQQLSARLEKHGICCVGNRELNEGNNPNYRPVWSLRMMTREELATRAALAASDMAKRQA